MVTMDKVEKAFQVVSDFIIKDIPDGWCKHNSLVDLQQSVWWALKGLAEDAQNKEKKND
jgi:hypothetical protein